MSSPKIKKVNIIILVIFQLSNIEILSLICYNIMNYYILHMKGFVKMSSVKSKKVILAAIMSALICVLTMFPKLPIPMVNGGYIHMGDALIIVAAFLLNPLYAALAAGIGSCLADLFSGYALYVPATFVIKAVIALIASALFVTLKRKQKSLFIINLLVALLAELVMVLGYFLFETILYGAGTAAVAIPFNLAQAAFGAVAGIILIKIIISNKSLKNLLSGELK